MPHPLQTHTWPQLKAHAEAKKMLQELHYERQGPKRIIVWLHYGGQKMVSVFNSTNRAGIDFLANYAGYIVEERKDSDGNTPVAMQPPTGSEANFYAPNLCDPCSWYVESTQVTEAAMTDSGDRKLWNTGGTHTNWIDMAHGRVYNEDSFVAADASLLVTVEVQVGGAGPWVEKAENSWEKTDNDFTVNYEFGEVTFNSALGVGDLVRATFKKAADYCFYIEPTAGKRLKIVYAEVQYTEDIGFNQCVTFTIEVYNEADLPNRVPYQARVYKTLKDYYQESTGPFPVVPAHGGSFSVTEVTGASNIQDYRNAGFTALCVARESGVWLALMEKRNTNPRAICSPMLTVPFHYKAYRSLQSSVGARIKITLDGDGAFGGEFANVTFYCLSIDE